MPENEGHNNRRIFRDLLLKMRFYRLVYGKGDGSLKISVYYRLALMGDINKTKSTTKRFTVLNLLVWPLPDFIWLCMNSKLGFFALFFYCTVCQTNKMIFIIT